MHVEVDEWGEWGWGGHGGQTIDETEITAVLERHAHRQKALRRHRWTRVDMGGIAQADTVRGREVDDATCARTVDGVSSAATWRVVNC